MVKFSGANQAKAVPLLGGGRLISIEWDAGDPSGMGPALPVWCDLRTADDAKILTDSVARHLAEQGFSGLVGMCTTWYDPIKTIQAKTLPWQKAIERARAKGLRDIYPIWFFGDRNGTWNPRNPEVHNERISDWYDEANWQWVFKNLNATLDFAKALRARGIFFDIESYGDTCLNMESPMNKNHPDIKEKAFERGRQCATLILNKLPNAEILVIPAYYLFGGGYGEKRELATPFIQGIADVLATRQSEKGPGGLFLGSEGTYGPIRPMTVSNITSHANELETRIKQNLSSVFPVHKDYAQSRIRLTPGVWPLGDYLGDEEGPLEVRINPGDYANQLLVYEKKNLPVIWVYNQAWPWFTSTWQAYANSHRRLRKATQYKVYRVDPQGNPAPVTQTPLLHSRFSETENNAKYLVRAHRPAGPEDANNNIITPKELTGVADDFTGPLGSWWTITAKPKDGALCRTANGRLFITLRGSPAGDQQVVVGFNRQKFTRGSVRLSLEGYQPKGTDYPAGVGLRLYADEKHWVLVERVTSQPAKWEPKPGENRQYPNGFRLRWRNGEQAEQSKIIGWFNWGQSGELGLDWNPDKVTWHVDSFNSSDSMAIKLPPCQVEIIAWSRKSCGLTAIVDDFILTGEDIKKGILSDNLFKIR
ncbi:MAG: hypothetical protein WC975_02375 [Phycisphaerae bacterium]